MKRVFKIFNFDILDYKGAETFLNDMAKKGYQFKRTGVGQFKGFAMFEKTERAQNLHYAVDVRPSMGEGEKERYYGFYKDLSWDFADCYKKTMHIFVSEKGKPIPLYTDEATEFETLREAVKQHGQFFKHGILAFLMILMCGFMIHVGGIGRTRLISYITLVFFIMFFLFILAKTTTDFLYLSKCKKCVTAEQPLPRNKMGAELIAWENCGNIVLYILLYSMAMTILVNVIWCGGFEKLNGLNPTILKGILGIEILSVPIMLLSNYYLYLNPKQMKYKVLNWVGYYMYFISIYITLSQYLLKNNFY